MELTQNIIEFIKSNKDSFYNWDGTSFFGWDGCLKKNSWFKALDLFYAMKGVIRWRKCEPFAFNDHKITVGSFKLGGKGVKTAIDKGTNISFYLENQKEILSFFEYWNNQFLDGADKPDWVEQLNELVK